MFCQIWTRLCKCLYILQVMSYSSFMYKNAGVDKDLVEWVVCLTSTINVLTTFVAVPLMEKLGRRPLLIWPMVGMLLSFVILTIFHNLQYVESLKVRPLTILIQNREICSIKSFSTQQFAQSSELLFKHIKPLQYFSQYSASFL